MASLRILSPEFTTLPSSLDTTVGQNIETHGTSYQKYRLDFALATGLSNGSQSSSSRALPPAFPVSTSSQAHNLSKTQKVRSIKTFKSLFQSILESYLSSSFFADTLSLPLHLDTLAPQAEVNRLFLTCDRIYSFHRLTKGHELLQLLTYE
jgi:hypothetical protein